MRKLYCSKHLMCACFIRMAFRLTKSFLYFIFENKKFREKLMLIFICDSNWMFSQFCIFVLTCSKKEYFIQDIKLFIRANVLSMNET